VQKALEYRWLQTAGRAAPFCHPLLFRSGKLVIYTQSPVWSTEVRHHLPDIKQHLCGFDLTDVEIRVIPQREIRTRKKPPKQQISERNRSALQSSARSLKHQGLGNALHRLAEKLERKPPDA